MISDDLVEQRAMRAYFRRFGPDASIPSNGRTEVFEEEGSLFVELSNVNGPLATYTVTPTQDGGFRLAHVP